MEESEEFVLASLDGAGAAAIVAPPAPKVKQLRTLLREDQKGGAHWADNDWYLESEPERITDWALMFLRLSIYMRDALSTNPYIRNVRNAKLIRARQRAEEERAGFVRFVNDFLDSCKKDINAVHFAVLGLDAHVKGASGIDNDDYLLACNRLLTLFVNICGGMFQFTEMATPATGSADRLPLGVRVQMSSTYFIVVPSLDMFKDMTLCIFIGAYRRALGFVIIARRITQAFATIANIRRMQAREAGVTWGDKDDYTTAAMRDAHLKFMDRFSPFIEADATIYVNKHAKKLGWVMNEALDVAYGMIDGKCVGRDFMTRPTPNSPAVVDFTRLRDLVLAVVKRIAARRAVQAALVAAQN